MNPKLPKLTWHFLDMDWENLPPDDEDTEREDILEAYFPDWDEDGEEDKEPSYLMNDPAED